MCYLTDMTTTEFHLDRITDRDRQVLRSQVADKIEQLLPLTQTGMEWRPTFEKQAGRLGALEMSSEDHDWAIAHAFVLQEVA